MANLITATDFVGEINIANTAQPDVSADLAIFISKYESRFLKQLFGADFYAVYIAGTTADPVDQRWVDLQALTEFKPAIADYIYYYYIRDQVTQTVGVGNVASKSANAVTVPYGYKQQRAFNEMVRYVYEIIRYITSSDNYPEYVEPQWLIWRMQRYQLDWWIQDFYLYPIGFNRYQIPEIFNSINSLNI